MIFKEVSNKSMNKVAIDKLFLKNGYINPELFMDQYSTK